MGVRVGKTLALAWSVLGLVALAACGRAEPPDPPAPPSAAEAEAPPGALRASATLDRVRARKRLRCGVADNAPGFSERNLTGQWRGFDVDLCRAVAAAVLGDSHAVSIQPLTSRTRYAALKSGAVDVLTGGGSFTFTHDVALGLDFVGISYYDSQGFLTAPPKPPRVRRGAPSPPPPPPKTLADLKGARICVQGGSPEQQVLAEGMRARGLGYQPIVKDDRQQALQAYEHHDCDAITGDLSVLAYDRSTLRDDEAVILTETLADDPLGPVVREDDSRWADVVRWALNALVLAEAGKLNSRTVEAARRDAVDPQVQRLLGVQGEAGRRLGLADDWAFRIVRQVGAYDEVFERNLGAATPLKLERGRNALWTAAPTPGLLYSPPLR